MCIRDRNPDAWKLALELAKEKDADIVLATDPDADRLGVYCKDTKTGEYVTCLLYTSCAMQYVQVHRHGDCEETEAAASCNQCCSI